MYTAVNRSTKTDLRPTLYRADTHTGEADERTLHAAHSVQGGRDELKDLPRALANVRDVLCNRLPRRPIPRLCSNRLGDDLILLLLQTAGRQHIHLQPQRMRWMRRTFVPCCRSNLSHHAQMSPQVSAGCSLAATARPNQSRAFSILRSVQNSRATLHSTHGSFPAFRSASADRALRVGRGSDQIANDHSRPDVGHSCKPVQRNHET